ncbi:hypothetical protein A2397_00730 [Candidatus Amesbacteria bacterium RIFOXYB1_FULL_44_23]|uniref:Uncharacterized protein n=1 Tax=Candidatus Amesbacteria bacterium RIFOXYB1_FULL_44_23 TaxID=1797263 RepID=A0A1F4ZRJ6_9BACT|nr:MAG: hypothetical protein A2397_00730 [Candidatus Amesbacteria bacterium RIFOXYB1_FULL_44_23]
MAPALVEVVQSQKNRENGFPNLAFVLLKQWNRCLLNDTNGVSIPGVEVIHVLSEGEVLVYVDTKKVTEDSVLVGFSQESQDREVVVASTGMLVVTLATKGQCLKFVPIPIAGQTGEPGYVRITKVEVGYQPEDNKRQE